MNDGEKLLYDILQYSVDGLRRRKLRSWLTIVGIVIGIMAIVLLVALGQGIDKAVRDQLNFFGEDTMNIAPAGGGFISKGKLTEDDYNAIKRIGGIEYSSPLLQGQVPAEFKGQMVQLYVLGFSSDYDKIYKSIETHEGRGFRPGDSGVVSVGYTIAHDYWGTAKKREEMQLGSRVILSNKSFTTIGILAKSGGGLAGVADIAIYVPYDDARDIIPIYRNNNQLTRIDIKLKSGADANAVEAEIKQILDNLHRVKNPDERDYRVSSSEQIKNIVGNVTGALTAFLILIAAISLLVGSIGVANTMFMSVLERTREIGVLKALGATEFMIMSIFLLEAALICGIGGAVGVFLSYLLITLVVFIASLVGIGLPLSISLELALGGIGVSVFVGVLAGLFPARRAARLQAVEALRYE